MSQAAPGHNHDGSSWGRAARWALGAAWIVTMAWILGSEVLARQESEDVRRLVESARLTRQHASARYLVRADEAVIGTISSTVSGSREEEQLAYLLEGELHAPIRVRVKGVVVAGWDRRPSRFAFDLDLAGSRHRVDGSRDEDGLYRVRYLDPSGDVARTWLLDELPLLAPGPLPMPALDASALSGDAGGELPNPAGGPPMRWMLHAPAPATVPVAGEARSAMRRELQAGPVTVVLFTEPGGFPLRVDLPGGVVVELAEEDR